MENKPIITCHGDQNLFTKLHPTIVHGLPRESVEWQRPYGRPVRQIYAEANFVPFNPSILPGDDDWTLLGRPFFHIYLTECDIDAYKAGVKEEIAEWITSLREKNIVDWLVIVAVNEESKVKSKILRTSVHDKVKSDFCSKQNDRCVELTNPFKGDIKTTESWGLMLIRLRQLLLQSYNRNLSRFEDHMRTERERRTEPGWSFFRYFMLQEELAFMYEMLGMYEDALVQYDELDALFTQFLLNHNAGDTAGWITDLASRSCHSWNGVCLSQPINIDKRQLIRQNEASLLDFRDYLFSRQCTALYLQFKPWEVAKRSIPFMHNCIKEIHMLKVHLPIGAIDCWVFLSCLEVLRTCEKFSDTGHMEAYSLYTASLWDYARSKLFNAGKLCGLHREQAEQTQEHHDNKVFIYKAISEGNSEPIEKLKEALSSYTLFYKHYLEYSELAMGTYKHIGRIRSARSIGMDLATFYMKLEEYQKAEGFLYDALKTFKEEGWDQLADNTRLHIAQCQKHLRTDEKYAKTCLHIAASKYLKQDTRTEYLEELLQTGKKNEGEPYLLRLRPAMIVHKISPVCKTFTMHKACVVSLTIHSSFPAPVTCESIAISIVYESPLLEHNEGMDSGDGKRRHISGQSLKHHRRQSSTSSTQGIEFYNHVSETKRRISQSLDLHVDMKHESRAVSSCGLICRSPLRRLDSGPKGLADKELVKEDFGKSFVVKDVVMMPGENVFELTGHLEERGRYLLGQLCVSVCGSDLLKSFLPDYITFNLVSDDPNMSLLPVNTPLITGAPQEVSLTLLTGSHELPKGAKVIMSPADGLTLWSEDISDGTIELSETPEYEEMKFKAWVYADISFRNPEEKYHLKARISDVGGSFHFDLSFVNPFTIKHEIRTAGTKKFIHIMITGTDQSQFDISAYQLSSDSPDIQLLCLNQPNQVLRVRKDQRLSFVWQLKSNTNTSPALNCTLKFDYTLVSAGNTYGGFKDMGTKSASYDFGIADYSTCYTVKSEIVYPENETFCTMGTSYDLRFIVKNIEKTDGEKLIYEVTADQTLWALSGKTNGVFDVRDIYTQTIEATPLAGGNLPLPIVTLHRYDNTGTDSYLTKKFNAGQVYNSSLSGHVYVVPTSTESPIDISITTPA